MEVDINYWGVLVAAVVNMAVGSFWYAKSMFGAQWQQLTGLSDDKLKAGGSRAMVTATVASLLTAYVLAHVAQLSAHFFDTSAMESSITTAFWLWLGISTTTLVTHNAFEQRPTKLTALAVTSQLVSFVAMGVVIGLFS